MLEIYKSCIILFRPNLDLVPQVLPKTKINFEPYQMTDHTYVVVQVYGWFNFKFSSILSIFILNYISLHIIIKLVCSSRTFLQEKRL